MVLFISSDNCDRSSMPYKIIGGGLLIFLACVDALSSGVSSVRSIGSPLYRLEVVIPVWVLWLICLVWGLLDTLFLLGYRSVGILCQEGGQTWSVTSSKVFMGDDTVDEFFKSFVLMFPTEEDLGLVTKRPGWNACCINFFFILAFSASEACLFAPGQSSVSEFSG